MMIAKKVNVNHSNEDGTTPVYIAAQTRQVETVYNLLNAGADPHVAKKNGMTPLMIASKNGSSYIVALLIGEYIDLDLVNNQGMTALNFASTDGHSDVVSLLIESGANPEIPNNRGYTPLMSETPCKYFLHSKSSFNSLYTLNLLFLHIPECKLLKTKFLNTLFILDTASLEPSEVEVRSISLIISKTHFFHCFLFLPGILHLFHSFSKTFLQKLSLPFFNNLENQTTFLLFLLKFKGSIPKSPHKLHCKSLRSNLKSFYMLLTKLHLMP